MKESLEVPDVISKAYHYMVLLVDDQAMVAEAVRRMCIAETDIDMHYCPDPRQAIAAANTIKPTVILQDLVMPQVDGLALVRHYRSNPTTQFTPVIVLSVKEDPLIKKDAFESGANDYLVKIPDRIELLARIRYHSRAYINQLQRDEAFIALRQSQQELLVVNSHLTSANESLRNALLQVKHLQGLLPICCYCKKVRDDQNYWNQIEAYISAHSELRFSHGICPDCYQKHIRPQLQTKKVEIGNHEAVQDNGTKMD